MEIEEKSLRAILAPATGAKNGENGDDERFCQATKQAATVGQRINAYGGGVRQPARNA
jgi:hypothetical protein